MNFFKILLAFCLSSLVWEVQAASLWNKSTNSQRSIFAGKRAYSIGDLITIDVSESSSLAASQNSVRNRQSQIENAVNSFLFANSKMGPTMVDFQPQRLKLKHLTRGEVPLLTPKILRAEFRL